MPTEQLPFEPTPPRWHPPGPVRQAVDRDISETLAGGGMVASQTAAATLRTLADQLDYLDADLASPGVPPAARVARATLQRAFETSYRATLIAPATLNPTTTEAADSDPIADAFAAFAAAEARNTTGADRTD